MARNKKKQLPLLEHVRIETCAAEGKALARVEDRVVFVPFVVPGDVVDLQVKKKKNSYMEAVAVHFHERSPLRAEPRCRHYGVCGGCKWQCLQYEEQLKAKQQQVYDNLTRIGKVELPEFQPILGSKKIYGYRNKLEFGFSNKRWLTEEEVRQDVKYDVMDSVGFHITGAFDKVLDITECHLMDDINNRIRNDIRDYALQHGLAFYDLRQNCGLLRSLMIRNSNTGELMLLVQFRIETPEEQQQADELMQHLAETFPQITSLLYVDNHKANDTFGDQEVHVFRGEDHIFEQMENLRFKVGAKSFYQTNTEQAYELYKVARSFALDHLEKLENLDNLGNLENLENPEKLPLIYDLYTGTGTIANFVAKWARQVIGIEYVPEAIEDAKVNSQINGIENTLFFAGDMKDILNKEFIDRHGRPDIIITDPPRAGMHPDVVQTILAAAPQRIVYVSCNPATQARDLQMLDTDYRVTRVQPVDMFPHTQHVENVVLLERR
jgi:23S rRNA (uracil1939-C5)-methyltransferase